MTRRDEFSLAVEAVELGVPPDFVTKILGEGITAHYYIDWDEEDGPPIVTLPSQKFEVSSPGMKKQRDANFDNPFALAWWMKNQGSKS